MQISEMREYPPAELRTELQKARDKVWKMRFQAKGEPIENPGALRQLRKDIARMLTVLREKELRSRPDGGNRRRGPGSSSAGKIASRSGGGGERSTAPASDDSASGDRP